MNSPSSITDNDDQARLELRVDGELAGWLDYIDRHPELDEFLAPSARRRRSPD